MRQDRFSPVEILTNQFLVRMSCLSGFNLAGEK